MPTVCNKCYVGGQYIMLLLHKKYVCIRCLNVHTKHKAKYEKARLDNCIKKFQESRTRNI